MEQNRFSFRRYMEADSDILYGEYVKFHEANILPYFSGANPIIDRATFLEGFRRLSRGQHNPPVIADGENLPCGAYRITYHHRNSYHELSLYLWAQKHLTEPVLRQILTQTLSDRESLHRMLLEVPGYMPELKQAAEALGMELIGTIPDYLCHERELYHKYFYLAASDTWSPAC